MYVDYADLNDGMLYIVVKREVPEEKKPKMIQIQ
jgi:HSP20 family molecular chaperone IbpA